MVKPKVDMNHDSFENFDSKLNSVLYDVVDAQHEMFQEPTGLPPKREIHHEIQLQQDCPLPNIGMYHMFIMENVEIKRKIKDLLEKGFHKTKKFTMWVTDSVDSKERWNLAHVCGFQGIEQNNGKESLPISKDR